MSSVDVSVIMPVYNHERYIEHALKSVMMQNFSGTIEVLVGEDCSSDNTRDVLLRVANLYPGRITPMLREKNMGAIKNTLEIFENAKGRYLAFLEGDDFWTDKYKLQKQVDFLDSNSEVIAVYHRTNIVDQDENETGQEPIGFLERDYTAREFERGLFPGHTSSLVCRNIFSDNMDEFRKVYESHTIVGDRTTLLILLLNGKIKVLPDCMSSYRMVRSLSAGNACSLGIQKNMLYELWKYYDALGKYAALKSSDINMEFLKHLTYVQSFERFLSSKKVSDLKIARRIKTESGSKETYGKFLHRCMFEQVARRITGNKRTASMLYFENIKEYQ